MAAVLPSTNRDFGLGGWGFDQCGVTAVDILFDSFRECANLDTVWIYVARMFNAAPRFAALDIPRTSFHPVRSSILIVLSGLSCCPYLQVT
jgi:hypothetical protein